MTNLMEFRKAKDQFLAKESQSPLTPEQRKKFTSLAYYQENSELRFVLAIEELSHKQKEAIDMLTSTGDSQMHLRWGTISFTVDDQPVVLTIYRAMEEEEFFLPFADTTNGKESYGAGRCLDLVALEDGRILVDFNYAYNPYCAYNPHWSCPIPPAENRLPVPIRAGEKSFPGMVEH